MHLEIVSCFVTMSKSKTTLNKKDQCPPMYAALVHGAISNVVSVGLSSLV